MLAMRWGIVGMADHSIGIGREIRPRLHTSRGELSTDNPFTEVLVLALGQFVRVLEMAEG